MRGRRSSVTLLAVGAAVVASTTAAAPGAGSDASALLAASSASGGLITLGVRPPVSSAQIRTTDFRGRAPRTLGAGALPSFSPNGRRIAFVQLDGGRLAVWVMRRDGTARRRLAFAPAAAERFGSLQWSPNGRHLLTHYEKERGTGGRQNAGSYDFCGGFTTVLLDAVKGGLRVIGPALSPRWSPDGRSYTLEYIDFVYGDHTCGVGHSALAVRKLGARGSATVFAEFNGGGNTGYDGVRNATWSPQGDLIAFSSATSRLVITRPDGTGRRTLGMLDPLSWSPDGKRIAAYRLRDESIVLLDVANGTERRLVRAPYAESVLVSWSPDGRQLLYHYRGLCRIDIRSLRLRCTPAPLGRAPSVDWRQRRVAYAAPPPEQPISLVGLAPDGSDLRRLTADGSWPRAASGGRLAFARVRLAPHWTTEHWLLDPRDRAIERLPLTARGLPVWSADGRQLAVVHEQTILVGNADGTRLRAVTLPGHVGDSTLLAWAPDGTRIAFAGDGFGVAATDGSSLLRFPLRPRAIAWSPDGRWIAYTWEASEGYALELIQPDGTNRRRIGTIPTPHITWSPDATRLAYLRNTFVRGLVDASGGVTSESDWQLWTMAADGGDHRQIASSHGYAEGIAWTP